MNDAKQEPTLKWLFRDCDAVNPNFNVKCELPSEHTGPHAFSRLERDGKKFYGWTE